MIKHGMACGNMCCRCKDRFEKLERVARAAEKEHKLRMGKDFQNGADCDLCESLKALRGLTK